MLTHSYPIRLIQKVQPVQKLSQVFKQLKNCLNLLTKKIVVKYQKIPVILMSIILHQFQMKTTNAVLKST